MGENCETHDEERGLAEGLPRSIDFYGKAVVRLLRNWYAESARTYPWRSPNVRHPNPWAVFVSETMLQQTQTTRVAELLPQFLRQFPTPGDCAAASHGAILRAWQGLGYNSRAIRLHEASRLMVSQHAGNVPRGRENLLALPGVGAYCANAVRCFAFGVDVALVEVNVVRVLSRIFFPCISIETTVATLLVRRIATAILDREVAETEAGYWNQALMDLGSTVCQKRVPDCAVCPIRSVCASSDLIGSLTLYRGTSGPKAGEPQFRGRPRRLTRGAIVAELRNCECASPRVLYETLFPSSSEWERERSEFVEILDALISDKLIEKTPGDRPFDAAMVTVKLVD